ncbi:MAG TPA: hypothetical protein VHI13_02950 [Candidatus Kapabacteria bacterium]|nr:hypothetical protein [Candidatus Kapabacteria bacterium]
MTDELSTLPPAHPFAQAVLFARDEIAMGQAARAEGNDGRVRVCARRAVGIFLQTIAPHLPADPGTHAMANLRMVAESEWLPAAVRDAAARLLGGARSIAAGTPWSTDPLGDAVTIINHYVRSVDIGYVLAKKYPDML